MQEYFSYIEKGFTVLWDLQFKGVFILTFPAAIIIVHLMKIIYRDFWMTKEKKSFITLLFVFLANCLLVVLHVIIFNLLSPETFINVKLKIIFWTVAIFFSGVLNFLLSVGVVSAIDVVLKFKNKNGNDQNNQLPN